MKIEPTEKQMQEVERVIHYWKPKLLLHGYTIITEYEDVCPDDPTCLAEAITAYPYLRILLKIFASKLWGPTITDWERERSIVHELIHRVVIPVRAAAWELMRGNMVTWKEIMDREEGTVDWITSIIMMLDGGLSEKNTKVTEWEESTNPIKELLLRKSPHCGQ